MNEISPCFAACRPGADYSPILCCFAGHSPLSSPVEGRRMRPEASWRGTRVPALEGHILHSKAGPGREGARGRWFVVTRRRTQQGQGCGPADQLRGLVLELELAHF